MGIRFHVRDNGIGMSPEFLPHMYDPFSQERSEVGDKVKGTGLGLPIVKSLVDIMGGTILVKSELRKGTEFIVDLYVPLAEPEEEEMSTDTRNENLMNARILLVEDNEINIYVAQLILEKAGCVDADYERHRCHQGDPGTGAAGCGYGTHHRHDGGCF